MEFTQIENERLSVLNPILQTIVRRAMRISSRRLDGGVVFDIIEQNGLKNEIIIMPKFEGKKKVTEVQMAIGGHMIATCMLQSAMEQRAYLIWGGNSQSSFDLNRFEIKI